LGGSAIPVLRDDEVSSGAEIVGNDARAKARWQRAINCSSYS
jgi:hypothetical protein